MKNFKKLFSVSHEVIFSPKNKSTVLNPKRLFECGEDAFFLHQNKKLNTFSFGVADGVGGWSEIGVDPSEFAWQLMNNCKEESEKDVVVPKQILKNAFEKIHKEKQVVAGSSTACLATITLSDPPNLYLANLGDSGLLIVREQKVFYKTNEQQHFFNCPFQLSIVPEQMKKRGNIADLPDKAFETKIELKEGDIVLVGTDGLFDNLSEQKICTLMNDSPDNLKEMSKLILNEAEKCARGSEDTPFSLNAKKNGYRFGGGKVDDITIVICKIEAQLNSKL